MSEFTATIMNSKDCKKYDMANPAKYHVILKLHSLEIGAYHCNDISIFERADKNKHIDMYSDENLSIVDKCTGKGNRIAYVIVGTVFDKR